VVKSAGLNSESDKIGGATLSWVSFTLEPNSAPSLAGLFVSVPNEEAEGREAAYISEDSGNLKEKPR